MSGLVLLVIGLAGLALVIAMLASVGVRAWRLARHARDVARSTGPVVTALSARSGELQSLAARVGDRQQELAAGLERLQRSAERLRILAEAWNDALAPWRSVRTFFGR
jgi:hypothetical protein